ncbi:MAG: 4-hydroxy-tetrahydrodipicolinate synthase [Clostridia bacterium]|nr:4-hydroxy-tetrahydrodipicolinate synthase [Clostridia bacterium]
MKKLIFKGAATAIVTPMNDDRSINFSKIKEVTENQILNGINALVVNGTTGEASTLSADEQAKTIAAVCEQSAGRVPIIAGAGSNDTMRALMLAKQAEELGADALLIVTPYYNKTSQNGIISHYTYIADRVDLPIIVYNVPQRTGVNIKPETYRELSRHKNIVAAKEASGDIPALIRAIDLCGDELYFYSGNDDIIVPSLSVGGMGVISVASNILPRDIADICNSCFRGNYKEAAKRQVELIRLIDALFCDVNPVPVKTAMNILGMNVGPVRMPLYPMSENLRAKLLLELKRVL